MFENSADFFGRIIVYSLDVLGEKASWLFFFLNPPHETGNDLSTGCWAMWWHLGNLSVPPAPHGLMWLGLFWCRHAQDYVKPCHYWSSMHLLCSHFFDQALCAWIMPFRWSAIPFEHSYTTSFKLNIVYRPYRSHIIFMFHARTQVEYSHILII